MTAECVAGERLRPAHPAGQVLWDPVTGRMPPPLLPSCLTFLNVKLHFLECCVGAVAELLCLRRSMQDAFL